MSRLYRVIKWPRGNDSILIGLLFPGERHEGTVLGNRLDEQAGMSRGIVSVADHGPTGTRHPLLSRPGKQRVNDLVCAIGNFPPAIKPPGLVFPHGLPFRKVLLDPVM